MLDLKFWKQVRFDIFSGQKKVVGWGTGGYFHYFYSKFPINFAYLIDNNPKMQGKYVKGFLVCSPDILKEEDPKNVIIIVYSSFYNEIKKQINQLGNYTVVSSSFLFFNDYEYYFSKIEDVKSVSNIRNPKTNNAILIQGPIIENVTDSIIKFFLNQYPNDYVIVSTWNNTDKNLLEKVRDADILILNKPPEYPGVQNRNYQIISTANGLKKAYELGIKYVLKVRSDLLPLSPNLFNMGKKLLETFNSDFPIKYGLKNRIIIPESFTKKYIPYHPSDMVMLGHTEDLLLFWDIELDLRKYNMNQDNEWLTKTIIDIGLDMGPTEAYLGVNFCNSIGWKINKDLLNAWDFLRQFFIVVDNNWFDIFWYKNPLIPDVKTNIKIRENVDFFFWQSLYYSQSEIYDIESEIYSIIWKDFSVFS